MRVVVTAVTFLVIGTLAISLIGKIRGRAAFREFVGAVAGLRVVPDGWATTAAVGSVAFEALVLLLLLLPVGPAAGLAAAAVLFAGFTTALAVAIRRGARVGCHCFGASETPVAPRHVVRSGLLAALACGASAYALAASAPSLGGIGAPQTLVAAAAAGIAVVALVRLDDLVWLFRGTTRTARRSE
jgi:Methylamine utilisation protein MauE